MNGPTTWLGSHTAGRAPSTAALAALAAPMSLAFRLVSVAVIYYLTARLGRLVPDVGRHVSLVSLLAGIAVAAYLRWDGSMSAGVFAAALAVSVEVDS